MARLASEHPTELELRILKILWKQSPLRVREIRQLLASGGHDIAHTTVVTMLNIMVDKQFVNREQVKNAFSFAPRVTEKEIADRMLGDVVNRVFDGSAKSLVVSLFDRDDLDREELLELRKLVNRKAKDK